MPTAQPPVESQASAPIFGSLFPGRVWRETHLLPGDGGGRWRGRLGTGPAIDKPKSTTAVDWSRRLRIHMST